MWSVLSATRGDSNLNLNDQPLLSCARRQCIAEFIGTAILIFFGVGAVAALVLTGASFGQWEISIVWGFGVAVAIYCTAGVSGAHINPAVTIALALFHGFEKHKVGYFVLFKNSYSACLMLLWK